MKHNWEYKKLGEISHIYSARRVHQSDWRDTGIPFYRAREIVKLSENGFVDNELFISPDLYKELAKSGIPSAGDVMVSAVGTLGATYIVKSEDHFYYKDASVICIGGLNLIKSEFLCYLFRSQIISEQINRQAKGATVGTITISNASKFSVPVPQMEVQEQIVAELDKLNEMIATRKEQLKELDNLAQSLFYDTFGDPISNPKGWEVRILEECITSDSSISYGIVQPGDDFPSGIPVVRPIDLIGGRKIGVERLKLVDPKISNSYKRTILKGGEILLCVRGTTGVVRIADSTLLGANVTRGITPIRFGENLNPTYGFEYLRSSLAQSYIQFHTKGTTLKQINMSDLRLLPIQIPPLSLQQQFAAQVESIERQKELVEASISELQTLLDSRMDYWFN